MKRIYVLFTALCVCCALAAQDIKELLILHTNDTHSRVEPIPITDPNPEFAGKAGFVRRVTLIKEMRKQNKAERSRSAPQRFPILCCFSARTNE